MDANTGPGLKINRAAFKGTTDFVDIGKLHALTAPAFQRQRHVVQPQHHVLRCADDRLTGGRREDVVTGHHQGTGFKLCLQRQRHVHRHLITVKVGVKRRADQRMQLNGLTLNEYRLKGLDTQAMQRRCAVEHDRVFTDDIFQDVPDLGCLTLDHLLRRFNGRGKT